MNKAELIDKLTEKVGEVSKQKVAQMVEGMLEIITETMKSGGEVALAGFGAFLAKTRKGRTGINPQTKAKIEIPPVVVPKFKPGKTLKDTLRGKV